MLLTKFSSAPGRQWLYNAVMLIFAATAFVFYVILCGVMWLAQRKLLFRPCTVFVDPSLSQVDGIELLDLGQSTGNRLYAWHLPPKYDAAPVIVYFNGNRGNISIWDGRWQRIAKAGAGFVAVSYRGFGGSTGKPSEEGLHADARAAFEWAKQHYPPERLILHGFSLGTGLATRLASENEAKALVLEAPYTSATDRARELLPFLPVQSLLKDKFPLQDWIINMRIPVLVVHGEKDWVIGIHHGRKVFELANEPKKMIELKNGSHSTATINGLYPAIWQFLGFIPDEQEVSGPAVRQVGSAFTSNSGESTSSPTKFDGDGSGYARLF